MGHKQKRQLARHRHTIHALRGYLREADAEIQRLKDAVIQATDLAINRGREISELNQELNTTTGKLVDLRRRAIAMVSAENRPQDPPHLVAVHWLIDDRGVKVRGEPLKVALETWAGDSMHAFMSKHASLALAPRGT